MASRNEQILLALLNGETTDLKPRSRMEYLLIAITNGTEPTMTPKSEMEVLLMAVEEKGIGKTAAIEPLTITENGTYTAPAGVDGYNPVTVAVEPVLQDKTVTENGEYTADAGYDGLGKVLVEVAGVSGGIKAKRENVTTTGVWGERVSIDFGFVPDFILLYPNIMPLNSGFAMMGWTSKFAELLGDSACYVFHTEVSSGKTETKMYATTIDTANVNNPIYSVDSTGFNIGKPCPAGTARVIAIGL